MPLVIFVALLCIFSNSTISLYFGWGQGMGWGEAGQTVCNTWARHGFDMTLVLFSIPSLITPNIREDDRDDSLQRGAEMEKLKSQR